MTLEKQKNLLKRLNRMVMILLLLVLVEDFIPSPVFSAPELHFLTLMILITALSVIVRLQKRLEDRIHGNFIREVEAMKHEIEKSAWRYKCLLEGAGNAIFVFNAETGILEDMNRNATELFGYSREEFGLMKGRDLVADDEQDTFSSMVMKVLRRGRVRSDGLRFRRKSGVPFLGEVDGRVIDLGDAKVIHVIVRDITYKRRAEREIRQKNKELSILMNFMARVNQSLQLDTVLHVTLRETIDVFAAEGGILHLVEEGTEHLAIASTYQISDELKEGLRRCSFRGGTGCIMMEKQHCHSVETLDQVPCSVGRAAAAEGWNSAAAAPLLARNRLIGVMHIMTRGSRQFTPQELNLFSTIGSQIGIFIEHARLFEKLNQKTQELVRSYGLLERSSHQVAASQRKLNKNLAMFEHANRELGRLDKMKSHFLGMISHEFKTPLTGIMGGAEYLMGNLSGIGDEEKRVLRMIYEGGARLNHIVSDLLKVVRLEASTPGVNRTILHVEEVMEVLQERFAPVLLDRGQHLLLHNLARLPYFHGDQEYLEEIFGKLLENAIKFSPDGGDITISGDVTDRDGLRDKKEVLRLFNTTFFEEMGDGCFLQLEVRDSGVGIASSEQVKVFDKFYEIGDICNHSTGKEKFDGKGTGIGLTIVKGMVEAHGGIVWVESPSTSGAGSSFFVLLPLEEGPRQASFPFMQHETPIPEASGFPSNVLP